MTAHYYSKSFTLVAIVTVFGSQRLIPRRVIICRSRSHSNRRRTIYRASNI